MATAFERFDRTMGAYVDVVMDIRKEVETQRKQLDGIRDILDKKQPKSVIPGRGRRGDTHYLIRTVVLLTVSVWQGFVEEVTREVRHARSASGKTTCTVNQLEAYFKEFGSPDSVKSNRRWLGCGMNVEGNWSSVRVAYLANDYHDVMLQLDMWLQVRHQLAHGKPVPEFRPAHIAATLAGTTPASEWPNIPTAAGSAYLTDPWKSLVWDRIETTFDSLRQQRQDLGTDIERAIRLPHAEAAIKFFRRLASSVAAEAANASV